VSKANLKLGYRQEKKDRGTSRGGERAVVPTGLQNSDLPDVKKKGNVNDAFVMTSEKKAPV